MQKGQIIMMEKCTHQAFLAMYDVTGIQEYIFASNRMKENAGASVIVSQLINCHLKDSLKEILPGHQLLLEWENEASRMNFSLNNMRVEVVYIGGGNAVLLYRYLEDYHAVNQLLAKKLLIHTYTLTLAVAYVATDFTNYGKDKEQLDRKLKLVKQTMLRSRPLGALPIVEQEKFYGLPITHCYVVKNEAGQAQEQHLSILQVLKRRSFEKNKRSMEEKLTLPKTVNFAVEMEDLVRERGEDGYVAVVHLDGNGMGRYIRGRIQHMQAYKTAVPEMQELSVKISNLLLHVFRSMLYCAFASELKSAMEQKSVLLPIRPLILDGDDVTFVCRADLAISLAALFMRLLADADDNQKTRFTACAGIALAHSHFPFTVAYEIAEHCCANAKKIRQQQGEDAMQAPGYMDFQLVRGAYVKEIDALRAKIARHTLRPYFFGGKSLATDSPSNTCSLDVLLSTVRAMSDTTQWSRTRLQKLYMAYLKDKAAIYLAKAELKSRGCEIGDLFETERFCPLEKQDQVVFDALEIREFCDLNILNLLLEGGVKCEETRLDGN